MSKIVLLLMLSGALGVYGKSSHYRHVAVIKNVTKTYKNLPKSVLRDLDNVLVSFAHAQELPAYYIKKSQACKLNWKNPVCHKRGVCNLHIVAKGKKIGGDKFNGISGWPKGNYREADLGNLLRNQCRNQYRLVFSENLQVLFFTDDHYKTFLRIR